MNRIWEEHNLVFNISNVYRFYRKNAFIFSYDLKIIISKKYVNFLTNSTYNIKKKVI